MEFSLSTFVLEIINFLILIWILQRLFYKPLLEVIDRRKQHIDQSLADAKKLHQEADELRSLYENRQKLWMQEKRAALNALHRQIEAEKSTQMDKLHVELEQERQKAKVSLTRQQQELQQQAEKQALQNGARFAGLLLQQAAGPEMETRLFAMLIDHLEAMPEDCRLCLQMLEHKKAVAIKVTSVFPFTTELRQQLEQKLGSLINSPVNVKYYQDPSLIAGIRIDIGAWVLHANLKHELAGFAEIAYESE
ncbi:MAG: F0F1 ATP synthase subunit delta [Methylococcales bacterium]|nr:F0F1 ATP synthase subunit delta [Methylococcales bacterium]